MHHYNMEIPEYKSVHIDQGKRIQPDAVITELPGTKQKIIEHETKQGHDRKK
jgi:hypothetical protein